MKCLVILIILSVLHTACSSTIPPSGVKLSDEAISKVLSPYHGMGNREITLYLQLPMLERIVLGTILMNGNDGHLHLSEVDHHFSLWMNQHMTEGEYTLHIPLQVETTEAAPPIQTYLPHEYGLLLGGAVVGVVFRVVRIITSLCK